MEMRSQGSRAAGKEMQVLSDTHLSVSASGRQTQFGRVLEKILKIFENIEHGQDIIIDGSKYNLTRRLDYCQPGYAGWDKDWVYDLRREDGSISISTFYHHNSPQNYMVTEKLTYNGILTTSDKETLSKIKGAFENYFSQDKDLPL